MSSRHTNRHGGPSHGKTSSRVTLALAIAACAMMLGSLVYAADGTAPVAKLLAVRSTGNASTDSVANEKAAPETSAADNLVEMFAAMKTGDVDVKFVPKDDREARVTLKNKTKRPLTVQLPAKFAAVPVLAQGRGGAGGGMNGMMGGQNQGMGGGMGGGMMGGGGMGGGMGGGGMGGGMFSIPAEKLEDVKTVRIPAEKSISFRLATVCLEYGKRDPKPSIPYKIVPLESLTTKPGVAELLTLLGNGRIGQRSAQAAAWNLANGVTWEHLASKRIENLLGDGGSYFSPDQISTGLEVAQVSLAVAANQTAKDPAEVKSAGDQASTSVSAEPAATGGKKPALSR